MGSFQVPPKMAKKVWGIDEGQPTMEVNMLIKGYATIDLAIDERYDDEYIAENFECRDRNCSNEGDRYIYTYNVDLDKLGSRILIIFIKLLIE